jgi:hypothetical protein
MEYERFLKITLSLQRETRRLDELHNMGINLHNFVDPYISMVEELMREVYGDEGYDWWSWFCWEADFGQRDWSISRYHDNDDIEEEPRWGAYDSDGKPICFSFESTWNYLEKNYARKT